VCGHVSQIWDETAGKERKPLRNMPIPPFTLLSEDVCRTLGKVLGVLFSDMAVQYDLILTGRLRGLLLAVYTTTPPIIGIPFYFTYLWGCWAPSRSQWARKDVSCERFVTQHGKKIESSNLSISPCPKVKYAYYHIKLFKQACLNVLILNS